MSIWDDKMVCTQVQPPFHILTFFIDKQKIIAIIMIIIIYLFLQDVNGVVKKSKGNHVRSEGFAITEVRGDLFTCSDGTSLAHCISQDIRMGKGIATLFKVGGDEL